MNGCRRCGAVRDFGRVCVSGVETDWVSCFPTRILFRANLTQLRGLRGAELGESSKEKRRGFLPRRCLLFIKALANWRPPSCSSAPRNFPSLVRDRFRFPRPSTRRLGIEESDFHRAGKRRVGFHLPGSRRQQHPGVVGFRFFSPRISSDPDFSPRAKE